MLSKSKLMASRQCLKRLWLSVEKPELAQESADAEAVYQVGHEVGAIARQLYGPGQLIAAGPPAGLGEALDRTHDALKTRGTFFEAAFSADDVLVLSDVVRVHQKGLDLVEVKSSASVKPVYLEDVAVQAWVLARNGRRLRGIRIAHIDTRFIYPGGEDYRGLLKEADVASEVRELLPEVGDWVATAKRVLRGAEPDIQPGSQCTQPYTCPFFDHCNPPIDGYPIERFPGLSGPQREDLLHRGITDARQLPAAELDTPALRRYHRAVNTGRAQIDPAALSGLKALPYPRYYLDFETISFAVPIWPGTRPYQALPFQWSLHKESAAGHLEHQGFLDLSGSSPVRRCMEALIAALERPGPVIVYSSYEKTILRSMQKLYPDLAVALEGLVNRLQDLLPITRAGYYHPDQQGSWSIKAVLPTLDTNLDYQQLSEVRSGMEAQRVYREAIRVETTPERREQIRRHLEAYCTMDSLAMVHLLHQLQAAASA